MTKMIQTVEQAIEACAKIADQWAVDNRAAVTKARKRESMAGIAGYEPPEMAEMLIGAAIECESIASEIRTLTAHIAAPDEVEAQRHFFDKVSERVQEAATGNRGLWRTCSGCHESEDGHDVGQYPFDRSFNCKLGAGCNECGGIGAIWDTIDYGEMAQAMLSDPALASTPFP